MNLFYRLVTALSLLCMSSTVWAQVPTSKPGNGQVLKVGSKLFPESEIIAELVAQLAESEGISARHLPIGSTQIIWGALVEGEIDVYPDYNGTIAKEILQDDALKTDDDIRAALAQRGIRMSPPLGFTNPYAIGMAEEQAAKRGIQRISDLREHPDLKLAFSTEFLERSDGWPGLRKHYRLQHKQPIVMEHALAYPAVDGGELDVTDVYVTDSSISKFGFRLLEDDAQFFPPYTAVLLYRSDVLVRFPAFSKVVERLTDSISADEIRELNAQVQEHKRHAGAVAGEFLSNKFNVDNHYHAPSMTRRMLELAGQHLYLVLTSLTAGILVAVPLGVIAAKRQRLEHVILSTAEILQTIPGLALLVLLIPLVRSLGLRGTGPAPVITALFLYSLLPIIRNTFTGMRDIPYSLRESAEVLGLTPWARLWQIELPLASRMILAGIKTTAVMTVGFATLGGLIGAGGFGQPISAGLAKNNVGMMLEGAIPAAVLALVVKLVFEVIERFVVPKGLRVQAGS